MDKSELQLWDFKRIFIGDAPPEFLVEVLIRSIIAYLLLLLAIRFLGKRMTAQISITELCVMITLGAIISPVMQLPDRGILFGVVVLATICLLHWFLNRWSSKNERVEKIMQGSFTCLVKDGILQVDQLHKAGISHEELFAQLRKNKIENLSEVKRVYLEACGLFSVFKIEGPGPAGLLVFPENDKDIVNGLEQVDHGLKACSECGHVQQVSAQDEKCEICHSVKWTNAYQLKTVS